MVPTTSFPSLRSELSATARDTFTALLTGFGVAQSISALDMAILEYATDGWPMKRLTAQYSTTASALHWRKRELFSQFREYLERGGITSSADVFDE
jgi:hypothetical protein